MKFSTLACTIGFALAPLQTWAAEITVSMSDHQYQPAQVSAIVGDTVRFVNDDDTDHNVFMPTAGFATNLGKQEPGQQTTLALGKAGKFDIECVFHPGMLTTVEVK